MLKRLDFSKADLWAAGAIGYEIFIRVNPFYKDLQSRTYEDLNLPALPADVPFPVQAVIERILRRNPVLVSEIISFAFCDPVKRSYR